MDVLKKVGGAKRQDSGTTSSTMKESPKKGDRSVKRREAVFDHHNVHPDWQSGQSTDVGQESQDHPHHIHQYHSVRLPETKNRRSPDPSTKNGLDRAKSVYLKGEKSPTRLDNGQRRSGTAGMSELNRMRTDRLANALKALEKKHPLESGSSEPTRSMKPPGAHIHAPLEGRSSVAECARKDNNTTADQCSPEDSKEEVFRRRTSSVPAWCAEAKGPSKPSNDHLSKQVEEVQTEESADYERMRNFSIDPSKGCLVKRGDSFRRRCNTGLISPPSQHTKENGVSRSSRNSSNLSSPSRSPIPASAYFSPLEPLSPTIRCTGVIRQYCIVVMGLEGVGKTSMIDQFMTSEYCNPFQSESGAKDESAENSVAVILNGEESQLTFIEVDNKKNDLSLTLSGAGYIVVYSIDDMASFENAKQVIFQLTLQSHSAGKPIILVGNKADLERKRAVSVEEGKLAAKENRCKFVEIAVALGHHVDELLVGVLAQVRHNDKERKSIGESKAISTDELVFVNGSLNERRVHSSGPSSRSSSDSTPTRSWFHSTSVKRSSTRRGDKDHKWKAAMKSKKATTSCSNLTSVSQRLADRVFGRRRGSRSVEDLLSIRK